MASLQLVSQSERPALAIRFERSSDYKLIRQIMTHPRIWAHVDDYSPSPDEWKPLESEMIWYVLVFDGEEVLGCWVFAPENAICWKIHTCLLPAAWGERARVAASKLGEWLFSNTPCLRVITDVPEYNRVALKFAKSAGMTEFGYNPASFMKNGNLIGQHMLGISKASLVSRS